MMLPFRARYESEIKESIVIAAILFFYVLYCFVAPFRILADRLVQPSVYGLTAAYSMGSTAIRRLTGLNLGFVRRSIDKDFIFRVQLASYVNEHQAQPIVDIAMDQLREKSQREAALLSLLKFSSHEDWIRPFLNDLPKGGMIGLYDDQSPVLDEVIRQIRLEGGIQKPLIRAYAEVSLSFMLQVPDDAIRKKTLNWVSDILAEDAIFLIIPRIAREKNPDLHPVIDLALWNVRAVSNRARARELLTPIYQSPPWPSIRLPVAAILARLGDPSTIAYLRQQMDSEDLNDEQRTIVRVALARTPYPDRLLPSEQVELVRTEREAARQLQYQLALKKQQNIDRGEMLPAEEKLPVIEPQRSVVAKRKKAEKIQSAELPATTSSEESQPLPGVVNLPAEKKLPPPDSIAEKMPAAEEQPALEKPEVPLPAEQIVPPKPQSSMRYVDMLFEVNDQPVVLYANAGDNDPSDVTLDIGSKGKANFEILINEEKWYQVKSKQKSGWVKQGAVKFYDLAPVSQPAPVVAVETPAVERAQRREGTYFEVIEEGISAHQKPDEVSDRVSSLLLGKPYLAVKSEKIGPDRWFLLKLDNNKEGWVAGINLQLAEVPAAVREEQQIIQEQPKSAFAAEWVVAGVEGVLVYDRPSMAGKILQKISPPIIYQVLETSSGGGSEWYKLKISSKKDKDGWVQAMDVSLTSKP